MHLDERLQISDRATWKWQLAETIGTHYARFRALNETDSNWDNRLVLRMVWIE